MKRLLGAALLVLAVAACAPPAPPRPSDGGYDPTQPTVTTPTTQPGISGELSLVNGCPHYDEVGGLVRVHSVEVLMANDNDTISDVDRFAVRWRWHIGGHITGSGLGTYSQWLEVPTNPDGDNKMLLRAEVGQATEFYNYLTKTWSSGGGWTQGMMNTPTKLDPLNMAPIDGWDETYLQVQFKMGRSGIFNGDHVETGLYGIGIDAVALMPCRGGA